MEQNHMLTRPGKSKTTQDASNEATWAATALVNGSNSQLNSTSHQQQPENQRRPSYSPPAYVQSHDPELLKFPDVPSTELPPIQPPSAHNHEGDTTLPPLSSVTGSHQHRRISSQTPDNNPPVGHQPSATVTPWPSQNPLTSYYAPGHAQAAESPARMDMDASSSSAMSASAASPDCLYDGRASSVSLDDPDVRLAAEALGDLRADFVSSPPNTNISLPASSPPLGIVSAKTMGQPKTPEPLLSLLTTSHPLLATTIEGGISAYNSSKNYSPRFKSGAEYVEGYVGPIANTLGSVGRATGVEGGVRWILGERRQAQHSDLESGESVSNKRRKMEGGIVHVSPNEAAPAAAGTAAPDQSQDSYVFKYDRRLSQASTIDTLPAYEEKSPAYTETADAQAAQRQQGSAPWQSRLFMSTSGLSVAMSEESLRSLKYCLKWLRWANDHISHVINTLKTTLEQYDQVEQRGGSATPGAWSEKMDVDAPAAAGAATQADRRELAARIASLKGDVLKTLRDVIDTVSKYAGGALPDNARVLVRRHLTSLPRKWQLAMVNSSHQQSTSTQPSQTARQQPSRSPAGEIPPESDMKDGAQRVLVLAKEGLDMMAQVSLVLDGTINSAEEWCDRLGRQRRGDTGEAAAPILPRTEKAPIGSGDVKMG